MFKAVNPKLDVTSMEDGVLKFWKKQDVFKKTIEQRKGKALTWMTIIILSW